MPQPTLGTVHTNAALPNMSIGYKNSSFRLGDVFPIVRVQKESDYYYIWDKGSIFRNEAKPVAPGGSAPRSGFFPTTATYMTDCYKFAWPVPDRVRANADAAVSAEIASARMVLDKIMLARDVVIGALLYTTTNWSNSATPGTKWDADNSDPIADVFTAHIAVQAAIGEVANTMVVNRKTHWRLLNNDAVLSRILYGGGTAVVTEQILAQIFGVQQYIVCDTLVDSANEGQTSTPVSVLYDSTNARHCAWLGYVAPSPSLMTPSAGYTFQVSDPAIKTYREEKEEQDVIEASVNFACKATLAGAGYVFTAPIS